MWLYTSWAWQPHRSVASKNGDLRYHGPKYSVVEVASGIVLASKLTVHLPSGRAHARATGQCSWARAGPPPELNDRSILTPPARPEAAYRAGSGRHNILIRPLSTPALPRTCSARTPSA